MLSVHTPQRCRRALSSPPTANNTPYMCHIIPSHPIPHIHNQTIPYRYTPSHTIPYLEKVREDRHLGVLDAAPPYVHVVSEDGVECHLLQRSHGLRQGIENPRDLQTNKKHQQEQIERRDGPDDKGPTASQPGDAGIMLSLKLSFASRQRHRCVVDVDLSHAMIELKTQCCCWSKNK